LSATEVRPNIVDWTHFDRNRNELGPQFIRILGYFKEDGIKSINRIEQAMHTEDAVALVVPAHTLKGESRQLGAEPLAQIAELIESTARLCIETRRFPDELVPKVIELRKLFNETVAAFDKETNPLMTRTAPGDFGRKVGNQDFGRI
jgi:HPt (histidine-containing phosphotransfer) domain-containing protein